MRVLLVNPPGWQKGSTNLGLCYLAGSLLADGHEVLILDVNATDDPPEVVAAKARGYAPDIIGFSLKTATANAAFLLSRAIRKRYDRAVHVAGGPHVTLAYEECLRENPEIDYCFLGEADASFPDFVRRREGGQDVRSVAGLAYREDGRIVATERVLIRDLDSLPFPSMESIDGFSFDGFRYPLITSRGCPYPCTYCCVGVVSSKKWRARSPENIIEELRAVRERHGITSFEILDDNFTLRVERAKEFCRLLMESGMDLSWYCHNGIRADKIDMELARLMKQAGCTSVALGVESGDEKIFESIKKGEPLEAVVNAVKCIKAAGMEAVGYFIIGLPGDSLEGIKKTIRFQQKLGLDNFTYGILNPYPYTEVYDVIRREGTMLMDIKESSHFSETLTIPFEMPGFPRQDMEKAYYLATYQALFGVLKDFEEKHGRRPQRMLYVDFSADSAFAGTLARVAEGYELDVLCDARWSERYEAGRDDLNLGEVHAISRGRGLAARTAEYAGALWSAARRGPDIVFCNSSAPAALKVASLALAGPSAFFMVAEDGAVLRGIRDRELRRAALQKVRAIPSFILWGGVALVLDPLFRLALVVFGLFLRSRRGGKMVEFTKEGTRLLDTKAGREA